jgi:hypothetical protein
MLAEQSKQSLTAIATVIAALIAAAMSFVNLTLNKEQKTSEFRQAWIDGLRQDLAAFFACARAFARATQELKVFGKGSKEGAPLAMTEQQIGDIRYQVAENRYRIQLRLNPSEAKHQELLSLMQVALDAQNSMLAGEGDTSSILEAVEKAAALSTQVLKSEWERVKRGELAFRVARNWVAPIVFFGSLLFVVLLWVSRFWCQAT